MFKQCSRLSLLTWGMSATPTPPITSRQLPSYWNSQRSEPKTQLHKGDFAMTKMLKSTLASLLESFFYRRLMAQRRASPATVNAYRDAWRLFLLFVSERVGRPPCQLSLQELDRDVVLAFLDHLELERNNTVRTRNLRLTAIRSFFQYVAYCDPAQVSFANRVLSIQSKKTTQRLMDYLRKEELDAILDATDRSVPQGRRDYALLLFLARTGARVSEAIGVNVGDLQLAQPSCVLIRGKGSKERMVPLAMDIAPVWGIHLTGRVQARSSPGAVRWRALQARWVPTRLRRRGQHSPRPLRGEEILVAHGVVGDGEFEHPIEHHPAAAGNTNSFR